MGFAYGIVGCALAGLGLYASTHTRSGLTLHFGILASHGRLGITYLDLGWMILCGGRLNDTHIP